MSDISRSPLVVAIALSLYAYNVSPAVRARALCERFPGELTPDNVFMQMASKASDQHVVTWLPLDAAEVYVDQALERYGKQAEARVLAEIRQDLWKEKGS